MPGFRIGTAASASVSVRWLGAACLFAWVWLVLFPNQSDLFLGGHRKWFLAGLLAACVIARIVPPRDLTPRCHAVWVLLGVYLSIMSFVLYVACEFNIMHIDRRAVSVLLFLAGCSCVLLFSGWLELYSRMKTDAMTLVIMLSLVSSSILYYFLWVLKIEFWGFAWACLPMIAAFSLKRNSPSAFLAKAMEDSKQELHMVKSKLASRSAFLSLLFFAVGYAFSSVAGLSYGLDIAFVPLGIGALGMLSVFGLWLMFSRKHGTEFLQYLCIGTIACISALILVDEGGLAPVLAFLTGSLVAEGLFFAFSLCADVSFTFASSVRRIRFALFAPAYASLLTGACLADFAIMRLGDGSSSLAFFVLAVSGFTILALLLFLKPSWIAYEMSSEEYDCGEELVLGEITEQMTELISNLSLGADGSFSVDSDNSYESKEYWHRRLAEVTAEYDLSPRQAEIFAFLSRGRNADYIANQLVISTNTVRTHIAGIYRKLEIHTQQELLSFFYQE